METKSHQDREGRALGRNEAGVDGGGAGSRRLREGGESGRGRCGRCPGRLDTGARRQNTPDSGGGGGGGRGRQGDGLGSGRGRQPAKYSRFIGTTLQETYCSRGIIALMKTEYIKKSMSDI